MASVRTVFTKQQKDQSCNNAVFFLFNINQTLRQLDFVYSEAGKIGFGQKYCWTQFITEDVFTVAPLPRPIIFKL